MKNPEQSERSLYQKTLWIMSFVFGEHLLHNSQGFDAAILHIIEIILWIYIACCIWQLLVHDLPHYLHNQYMRRKAYRPSTNHGSARWANPHDHKRYGQYDTNGMLLGCCAFSGRPLFFKGETHTFILGPAGTSKTVSYVINMLLHWRDYSMLVVDVKGTLSCITAAARRAFGHKTIIINPTNSFGSILGESARFNPLSLLIKAHQEGNNSLMMIDARAFAEKLIPEPKGGGENQYFRDGARNLLVFLMIYVVIIDKKHTFTMMLKLLRNDVLFKSALMQASLSDALNGDLADMANELTSLSEASDKRHFESFKTNAIQALFPFSESGGLAECTSTSDFDYADLKREKTTVYIIPGESQNNIIVDINAYCAMRVIMRLKQMHPRVIFLLDESTNFYIHTLISKMTVLREYGILLILIAQELKEYIPRYGKNAIATILSQAECKIFLGGNGHSLETTKMLSEELGNTTVKAENYALGHYDTDLVKLSVGEQKAPLLSTDEIRRVDKTIALIKTQPPILLDKVGYHEISPYRDEAAPNPMHGDKPFIGKLRFKIKYPKKQGKIFGRCPKVTWYRKVKIRRPKINKVRLIFWAHKLLFESLPFIIFWWFVLGEPTPHVLFRHDYVYCEYFGKHGIHKVSRSKCPIITFLP